MATNSRHTRRLLREMALDDAAVIARTREARELAGLTQEEVADALERHINTVRNWEKSIRVPMGMLNQLASVLNVTPEWILHGDDAPAVGMAERLDRMEQMLVEVLRRLPPEGSPQ